MMDAEALVFVVDDDASLRASLQDLLASVGLQVVACASAQDFLRQAPAELAHATRIWCKIQRAKE
jgi:FixJ family two-component response regulator